MADKKQNEIIAEQRKARREFLELKKMQADSGEKTYSKEISSLKTPADRIKHIWYYYKWYIISLVALIILISVSVSQCVNATKYDFGIVAFGYYSVTDESLNKLAEYMAQNCEDINGDGEVNIEVINCTYDSSYGNAQYEVAVLTKVQAILSSNYDKLIYITDERGYDYIM
ncbi:MAG: hypothetical protein II802_00735, partial [Clostridia bacterium]|nr:hypothetical protein [Clostridia bacterium]